MDDAGCIVVEVPGPVLVEAAVYAIAFAQVDVTVRDKVKEAVVEVPGIVLVGADV